MTQTDWTLANCTQLLRQQGLSVIQSNVIAVFAEQELALVFLFCFLNVILSSNQKIYMMLTGMVQKSWKVAKQWVKSLFFFTVAAEAIMN